MLVLTVSVLTVERAAGEPGAFSTFEPEEHRGPRVVGAGFMLAAVDSD